LENCLNGNVAGSNYEFLSKAYLEERTLYKPVEHLLKGKEFKVTYGISFSDHDKHIRIIVSACWYLDPFENKNCHR